MRSEAKEASERKEGFVREEKEGLEKMGGGPLSNTWNSSGLITPSKRLGK